MKDSRYLLPAFVLLLITMPLLAQKGKKKSPDTGVAPVADARGRRIDGTKVYPDSTEFEKTFKEFYPLVKPKSSLRELAEKQVERQISSMTKQGIDSGDIVKVAYTGLDNQAGYKIYFDVYRQKLTAKELKAYLAFLKTPEGASVYAATQDLSRAQAELNNYITKTINTNLTPIRTTMRENMLKSQKEKEVMMKSDTTEAGKAYRKQMQVRDSILNSRGLAPNGGDELKPIKQ